MEKDELFELVAVLTAKNTALEKEIERLCKQTDRLWEDLKEYQEEENDEWDDDDDCEETEPSYFGGLSQKIDAINSRLGGTNSKLEELEKKVRTQEEIYLYNNSKIKELDRWSDMVDELLGKKMIISQIELTDRVTELEKKEDNDGKNDPDWDDGDSEWDAITTQEEYQEYIEQIRKEGDDE